MRKWSIIRRGQFYSWKDICTGWGAQKNCYWRRLCTSSTSPGANKWEPHYLTKGVPLPCCTRLHFAIIIINPHDTADKHLSDNNVQTLHITGRQQQKNEKQTSMIKNIKLPLYNKRIRRIVGKVCCGFCRICFVECCSGCCIAIQ